MGTANAWIGTLRLRTLPVAATPVIVASALAWGMGAFTALPAAAALTAALLLQVGTNMANDYYDHVKGADTPDRAGPVRASASGALPALAVRNAAYATFAAAGLVGLYLAWVGGWPIVAIGVAALLSGILYTAGPRPIAYVGLGEVFVFVFFGPLAVAATVFVQSGTWEADAWLWGIALGLLSAAILVVNNLRDIPTDAVAGKRTLAVRLGERATRSIYTGLVLGAFLLPFVLGHLRQDVWLLLPVLASVAAVAPLRVVWTDWPDRRAYNPALGATARLLLVYGLLVAVAVAA